MALTFRVDGVGPSVEVEGAMLTFKRISSREIAKFIAKMKLNPEGLETGNLNDEQKIFLIEMQPKFMAENCIKIEGLKDEFGNDLSLDKLKELGKLESFFDMLLDKPEFKEFSEAYQGGAEKKPTPLVKGKK